jgi:hypothetical protein
MQTPGAAATPEAPPAEEDDFSTDLKDFLDPDVLSALTKAAAGSPELTYQQILGRASLAVTFPEQLMAMDRAAAQDSRSARSTLATLQAQITSLQKERFRQSKMEERDRIKANAITMRNLNMQMARAGVPNPPPYTGDLGDDRAFQEWITKATEMGGSRIAAVEVGNTFLPRFESMARMGTPDLASSWQSALSASGISPEDAAFAWNQLGPGLEETARRVRNENAQRLSNISRQNDIREADTQAYRARTDAMMEQNRMEFNEKIDQQIALAHQQQMLRYDMQESHMRETLGLLPEDAQAATIEAINALHKDRVAASQAFDSYRMTIGGGLTAAAVETQFSSMLMNMLPFIGGYYDLPNEEAQQEFLANPGSINGRSFLAGVVHKMLASVKGEPAKKKLFRAIEQFVEEQWEGAANTPDPSLLLDSTMLGNPNGTATQTPESSSQQPSGGSPGGSSSPTAATNQ